MRFHLRDLIWLTVVVAISLSLLKSVHEARALWADNSSLRNKIKSAAATVEKSEDEREAAEERTREVYREFAKYEIAHPESATEAETVTIERKTYDRLWAENVFLKKELNPGNLRLTLHYHDGEIWGYGINGIMPRRRVIVTAEPEPKP